MKITSLTLKLEKSEKEVKGLLDSRDSSEIEVSKKGSTPLVIGKHMDNSLARLSSLKKLAKD